MASSSVALALRRALDVESVPMGRPPRRPGPAWLLNPRRLEIVLAAAAYPGIHLRSASRLLLSPLPSLRFHLRRLEEERLIKRARVRDRVHLFILGMFPPSTEPFLIVWQNPIERGILAAIRTKPGTVRSDLLRSVGASAADVDRAIRVLVSLGAIRRAGREPNLRLHMTVAWKAFEARCESGEEQRLRRFLSLLESQSLNPTAEAIEDHRARISVDGPKSRVRFVLPLDPLR